MDFYTSGKKIYELPRAVTLNDGDLLVIEQAATGTKSVSIAEISVAGPQGIQGVVGPQGPQGLQGLRGPTGDNGITPHVDPVTKNWFLDTFDTGVYAIGPTGPEGPMPDMSHYDTKLHDLTDEHLDLLGRFEILEEYSNKNIDDIHDDIKILKDDMLDTYTNVDAIQIDMVNMKKDITRILNVETTIDEHIHDIDYLKYTTTDNISRLDMVEGDVEHLKLKVSDMDDSLTITMDSVTDLEDKIVEIDDLKVDMKDAKDYILDLLDDMSDVTNDITDIGKELYEIKGDITDLDTLIGDKLLYPISITANIGTNWLPISDYFIIHVNHNYFKEHDVVEISLGSTANKAQYNEYVNIGLVDNGCYDGYISLKCFGVPNTTEIPINIAIWR